MAWYGPSGECGCCDQAGGCQCVPLCSCTDPENTGFSLIGKKFTISGFPAVIELKWAKLFTVGYGDTYIFVSGLDKFNNTYTLQEASIYSGAPIACSYGAKYEDDVFVQVFSTTLPEQDGPDCEAGLTQLFSGLVRLTLTIRDNGEWQLKQPIGGPFAPDPLVLDDGTGTLVISHRGPCSGYRICRKGFASRDPAWIRLAGSPSYGEVISDLPKICQNNSYIFRIDYSMEAITSDFRDKTISGWSIAVSEIPNQIYLRTTLPGTDEAIRIDGADVFNGEYFLPSISSRCAPANYEEEVTLPYEKLTISRFSPCFIVEGGETGTLTARFKYEFSEILRTGTFKLEFDIPYVIGTVTMGYSAPLDLTCIPACFERSELENQCFPTYNQVVFKVCHTPQIE